MRRRAKTMRCRCPGIRADSTRAQARLAQAKRRRVRSAPPSSQVDVRHVSHQYLKRLVERVSAEQLVIESPRRINANQENVAGVVPVRPEPGEDAVVEL